jgi:serine/threonine protein kinase
MHGTSRSHTKPAVQEYFENGTLLVAVLKSELECEEVAYAKLRYLPAYQRSGVQRSVVASSLPPCVVTAKAPIYALVNIASLKAALVALRSMHCMHVLHGDLKADHVHVSTSNQGFFIDFGSSCFAPLATATAYTSLFT